MSEINYKSILEEAIELRSGDRNRDYGDAIDNYKNIAEIASAITGMELTPIICCKVMIATKLSREKHKPKRDNRVDLCGYADILDILEQDAERQLNK